MQRSTYNANQQLQLKKKKLLQAIRNVQVVTPKWMRANQSDLNFLPVIW